MVMNITNTTNTRGCLKDVYKVYVKKQLLIRALLYYFKAFLHERDAFLLARNLVQGER